VLHPGKTGGTALKHALLEYEGAAAHRPLLHGHEVTLADVPAGEPFMFIVRDPVSRFASGFNGRLREGRPRYHYPWREEERVAFGLFQTPDELAVALSSTSRRRRRAAERAMRGIAHVNTSYAFWFGDLDAFGRRVSDLFFVAFQDRLDDDFELLKRKLELPDRARLPRDATLAHRTPADFATKVGDVGRANLERWYADDFAFVALCRELAPRVNAAEPAPATAETAPPR